MTPGAATARSTGTGSRAAALRPEARRCAIYSRKSIEERHATDFGSIDAQRESCEAFIRSQASLGWTPLPTRYEDEGYTGANTDRPALDRLLADVRAGNVDVIVVYKIDRLSRSIGDFVKLTELFDQHGVAFVSVTQQFNTTTSAGRLTLNLLTVFAQFERETISERTRDKMRAARRKGKFVGGPLLLGFDLAPEGHRLVLNTAEAEHVRAIFGLFLQNRNLRTVAADGNARSWTTKAWTTKRGRTVAPKPLTARFVGMLLRNPAYVGRVRIGDETVPAEHEGIVDPSVFDAVQALLDENAATGGRLARQPSQALLAGLLRCAPCDRAMGPVSTNKGGRRYAYYVCRRTREIGWAACPTKSVSAPEIERLVADQIRAVGTDPEVQARVLAAARAEAGEHLIDEADLRRVLGLWDEVWSALLPAEQARILGLLIERVRYDGVAGTVTVDFRATGIAALAKEVPA